MTHHRLAQKQAREQLSNDGRLAQPAHQIGQQPSRDNEQRELREQMENLFLSKALQVFPYRFNRADSRTQ